MPDFCGMSPGGLSYGFKGKDYQGHSFWDTAIWMFPPILVLQPSMARSLVEYRVARLDAALDYARSTGWSGARFPWESAYTGGEVCPDWAAETRDNQHHITADISYAVRQFLAITGDSSILSDMILSDKILSDKILSDKTPSGKLSNSSGCEAVHAIAEFWAGRAQLNKETGLYDIKGVMGPDEYHGTTDNNVYTNVAGGMAIYFARYASCVAGCQDIPEEWIKIARSLSLQYDETKDYHPQYEGYEEGTTIKQADTILVGYPLMYDMKESTRRNDLAMYETVTDIGGPAMTWGMHAVGHLELGQEEQAQDLFRRSYEPYVHPPFYMWTENILGTGAVNFLTGMGGFLQGVLFGYLGLRTRLNQMDFDPKLPPGCSAINCTGINYHDAVLSLKVEQDAVVVLVEDAGRGLEIIQGDESTVVTGPDHIFLFRYKFSIRPLNIGYLERCPLPADKIGGFGPNM